MIKEVTYESVIESLKEKLPSLPQILEELVNKLSDPYSNLDNIEELVEIDQAITAEILKVSNKVEFTEPHESRIVTIHDALHKIGFENAKRIACNGRQRREQQRNEAGEGAAHCDGKAQAVPICNPIRNERAMPRLQGRQQRL